MSILLEALRKSENSQKKGEIPTIHGYDPSLAEEEPGRAPRWWWLVAIIIALLAGYFAWNQFNVSDGTGWNLVENPSGEVSSEAVANETTQPPEEAPLVEPPANLGRERQASGQTTKNSRAIQEPDHTKSLASRPSSPVESLPSEAGEKSAESVEPSLPKTREERAAQLAAEYKLMQSTNADGSKSAAAKRSQPASPSQTSPQATNQPAQRETSQPTNRTRRPPPANQQTARQQESAGPAPITFWELPDSVRSSLPELKINVLVYATNPADRFILMGGKRIKEGDNVIDGLDLREIRRDGAVFSSQKYQFLVKQ